MKYLSLLIILLGMILSWSLVHSTGGVTEYVHMGIQDELQQIITEQIEQRVPNTREIKFEKMWTETLKSDSVKASFIYSFVEDSEVEGPTRVQIEGFAILSRKSKDAEDNEVWSLDQLSILDNVIQFDQGITIRSSDLTGEQGEEPAPQPAEETTPAQKQ